MDKMKQNQKGFLTVTDIEKIKWMDSRYYPNTRTAEHKLKCMLQGIPNVLTYEVSHHDDGEGFVIHSEGRDIWDHMSESEFRKLEELLSEAVEYGHWRRDLERAETVEAVREVRYSLYETENLRLTREQIRALHKAIDCKEKSLERAGRNYSNKKSTLRDLGEKKSTSTYQKKDLFMARRQLRSGNR